MATKSDKTRQQKQLNPQQELALSAILLGKNDEAVAAAAGVTRQTVCEWRNHNYQFIAELNRRRAEIWDAVSDRMRAAMLCALDVISTELERRDNVDMALSVLRMCKVNPGIIGSADAAEIEGDRLAHGAMVGGRLALARLDL